MVDAGLGNILSASLDMNLLPLDEIIDGTSSSSSSQEE